MEWTNLLRRLPDIVVVVRYQKTVVTAPLLQNLRLDISHYGTISRPGGRCDDLLDSVGLGSYRAAFLCQAFEEGGAWLG